MYARVRKATGEDGSVERFMLRRVAGREELQVSLWATREDAAADPTAEWYEVEADQRMASGGADRIDLYRVVPNGGPVR
jgi:hypothetical protein